MVKPLRSTQKQINDSLKSSKYFIKYSLDSDSRQLMAKILRNIKRGVTSKKMHSKHGIYTKERLAIHDKIIRKFLNKDKTRSQPDVYVFGGPAGSGKTSVLAKFVKEKAITINNDDIKAALARYDPSPSKKYPLLHASYLHDESQDIENKIIKIALDKKKDIILDRTLANYKKNRDLLKGMKSRGYKVTLLGTNLPPHIALIRASARFISKGRYVPLEIVAAKGNRINASVMKMAKQKFVKKARVYNTQKKKPVLMYKRGK